MAHNPEVAGSNPAPATSFRRLRPFPSEERAFCVSGAVARRVAATGLRAAWRRDGGDGVARNETAWTWWTLPPAISGCLARRYHRHPAVSPAALSRTADSKRLDGRADAWVAARRLAVLGILAPPCGLAGLDLTAGLRRQSLPGGGGERRARRDSIRAACDRRVPGPEVTVSAHGLPVRAGPAGNGRSRTGSSQAYRKSAHGIRAAQRAGWVVFGYSQVFLLSARFVCRFRLTPLATERLRPRIGDLFSPGPCRSGGKFRAGGEERIDRGADGFVADDLLWEGQEVDHPAQGDGDLGICPGCGEDG